MGYIKTCQILAKAEFDETIYQENQDKVESWSQEYADELSRIKENIDLESI